MTDDDQLALFDPDPADLRPWAADLADALDPDDDQDHPEE